MKLGILGTGMIVKDLMTTVHKLNFEKMYILGTKQTQEETEALASKYDIDQCFYNYEALLDSDIDTVYVALPNYLHYAFAKQALQHGKHVIIEKPITSNVKELQDLIETAKAKDLIILEAMNIHYLPSYQSVKNMIGQIGQIKIVSLNYSQYSSRYDAFKNGEILPAFDYHKSGGALMDLNVYNLHFLVGLFGQPKDLIYKANIENNIDTSGILLLDYDDFKVMAIGAKDCQAPIMSSLQGNAGSIIIHKPVNSFTEFEFQLNNQDKQIIQCSDQEHRLYYEFNEFIKIIDHKDYVTARQKLDISLTVCQLMEKARFQQNIIFDADRNFNK